ncbi:MAG: UDP-3-O-[3-hydroxymyristoyl] N-acetylglucosamine deacetylase [Saprospiraceae bacterium]|jgi:UDP-3-O-[3-hydroxymyristoyl] N-acetylglucosamine deacetylase/3-hydroxyacyl-[acyl-carrier-protein] dehydratase
MKKQTIAEPTTLSGKGLHTGEFVNLTILPAADNHGIKFKRTDLEDHPIINADVSLVTETNRGTKLSNSKMEVGTVEHVLSALYALGIDNALLELDGAEVPIMDGSALPFVNAINAAGIVEQEEEREYFEVEETITYTDEESGAELVLMPSDKYEITTMIDFDSPVLGQQYAELDDLSKYTEEIAPCKTFVFVHELVNLIDQDLIKGGALENAIVIANDKITQESLDVIAKKVKIPEMEFNMEGIVNKSDLKFSNEPARHKLLDVIGDLALVGKPIKGKIVATRPGHKSNIEFAKIIKKHVLLAKKLKGKPKYDPNATPVYDIEQVKAYLPHRYPFLMLDKIIQLEAELVVGVKNVTGNENFFPGHFPGNPVFPGVLQMEALAQTGGILALHTVEDPTLWDTYFLKMDNVKFKRMVKPGDTLVLKMELLSPIRRGIVHMQGTAYVGNTIVSEGELTAQIIKRP